MPVGSVHKGHRVHNVRHEHPTKQKLLSIFDGYEKANKLQWSQQPSAELCNKEKIEIVTPVGPGGATVTARFIEGKENLVVFEKQQAIMPPNGHVFSQVIDVNAPLPK